MAARIRPHEGGARGRTDAPYAAPGLVIPSLPINDCSVVRFNPSRAAAPRGPPSTQFVSWRTRRTCVRSTPSRVAAPSSCPVRGRRRSSSASGTPLGHLEAPDLLRNGPGEHAPLVAEELALE